MKKLLRFDVILLHDWLIEQCLLLVRVFFGGKTKRPCFDLFIHWLIKLLTNTYRNHFSRSCTNIALIRTFRCRCSIYIRSCLSTAPIFPSSIAPNNHLRCGRFIQNKAILIFLHYTTRVLTNFCQVQKAWLHQHLRGHYPNS